MNKYTNYVLQIFRVYYISREQTFKARVLDPQEEENRYILLQYSSVITKKYRNWYSVYSNDGFQVTVFIMCDSHKNNRYIQLSQLINYLIMYKMWTTPQKNFENTPLA